MKKDIAEKSLLEEDDVFADIANVNLFNGAQTILPENLQCAPTTGYYRSQDGKQRMLFRDVAKQINGLHGTIAFIGFENQSAISNIMPVRAMGYNYTSYMKQVDNLIAENRKNKNPAFSKEIHDWQRLKPVATYILYYGTEKWEKPVSLMDMLDISEKDKGFWGTLIDDYKIKVIHMANQPESVRKKYKSDYRVIADFLACKKDKEALKTVLRDNEQKLVHVPQVLDMLDALSGDNRFEEMKQCYNCCDETKKEEGVNMCELFDMVEEDGIKKGIKQGLKLGADIFKVIRSGINDNNEIAEICNCKVEDVKNVRQSFEI
ncbi:MAG: hypothetical protein NC240_10030 [Clostridium sp.]|nr:hypothetical protein [Clostridium sp.]